MTNFLQHISELYPLWQQASLYPKFMSAFLLLSPVIFTVCGIAIVNYNIAKRAKERHEREQKANQSTHKTEVKKHE